MLFVVGKISRDFREYLAGHNIPYGLFAAPESKTSGTPHVYPLDFTSKDSLLTSLSDLQPAPEVSAVITTGYEQYVVAAAHIAGYFKVPSLSPAAARAATDKITMREKFQSHNSAITPDFAAVNSWQDIENFVRSHQFPVMLKPANLMKSLYISKNGSLEELQRNYETMLASLPAVYARYGLAVPRIIIEECMSGSMHTVAGFVDAEGRTTVLEDVVDCVTAGDLGKPDNYLFARVLPTRLGTAAATAVKEVVQQGVSALGLTNTPIHAEIILTASGPKLIEIGARLGGYRPRMYGYAKGIDMYGAAIGVASGNSLHLQPTQSRACTVLELFAETEGSFSGVGEEAGLHRLASYRYSKVSVKPGAPTGRAQAGFRAPLVVMLGHDDTAQVAADADWICSHVTVRLQA